MEKVEDKGDRFEEFKELEDGTGFIIPSGEVFKTDSHGGWFDENGKYFNQDAENVKPPQDSLKIKRKLMEAQKKASKLNKEGHHNMDDEEYAEYYDVVYI